MASDGFTPTHQEVQQIQLTRLDIVHLLQDSQIEDIITGCFVRVLLEIEAGREDYRIFTIRGIDRGNVYQGFSSDQSASTDLYINLNLPNDLRGINGTAFQLNSVSNSRITLSEYNVWLRSPGPMPHETRAAYATRIALLRRPAAATQSPVNAPASGATTNGCASPSAVLRPSPGTVGSINGDHAPSSTRNLQATTTIAPNGTRIVSGPTHSIIPEVISPDAALRAVMEDLRETHAVFVDPEFEGHKTSLLRTAERDLADYLDKLREVITSQRQTCVVCMDRAPTVVTLPCKHKILCRLCASQVNTCPCCRETTVELFEPIEP